MSENAKQIKFFTNVAFDYQTLDIGHIERIMRTKLVPSNVLEAFGETMKRHKTRRVEQRRTRMLAELEDLEAEAAEQY